MGCSKKASLSRGCLHQEHNEDEEQHSRQREEQVQRNRIKLDSSGTKRGCYDLRLFRQKADINHIIKEVGKNQTTYYLERAQNSY